MANWRALVQRYQTYGDTGTTGTENLQTLTLTTTPSGASDKQVFATSEANTYNSSNSVSAPGYNSVKQLNLTLTGAGTHDKGVVQLGTASALGGNVTSLLGFESELVGVGASTTVGSWCAYYSPNLSSVSNIGNVDLFYSFANDHVGAPSNALAKPAISKESGITVNGRLTELSPAYHPGLVAGQYYSAPTSAITPAAVLANTMYCIPVIIPHRCLPTKLGINVTTAVAGNVVIGLYNSACSGAPGSTNGVPTTLVAQISAISTGTTGIKEGAITISDGYVDAGLYFIVVNFSADPSVTQFTVDSSLCSILGLVAPTDLTCAGYISTAYSATMPSTIGVMAYSSSVTALPRAWFRIG